jgi:hypothetical protein
MRLLRAREDRTTTLVVLSDAGSEQFSVRKGLGTRRKTCWQ